MQINQTLANIGLSDKEIQVYLALLKLNSAPASSIARNSGIKRVSVYPVLTSLVAKGIAREHVSGDSKYFSVIEPEALLKKQQEKVAELEQVLPELAEMMGNYKNKPLLQYFQGASGLKELYDDLLGVEGDTIHAFLGIQNIDPALNEYMDKTFLPKRIRKNIKAKVILSMDEQNSELYRPAKVSKRKSKAELLTESKTIAHPVFRLGSEINLYGDDKIAVVLFHKDEMSGFILQSSTLHNTLRSIFDLLRLTH